MKRNLFFKKILIVLTAFALVFSALSLSACSPQPQSMSFAFTLTDRDVDDALAAITQLETYIDTGKNVMILSAVMKMNIKMEYIQHQYLVGQVKYYSDLSNEEAYNAYVSSEDAYMTVREGCLRVLKKLYQSDLAIKETVFADWTDSELHVLTASNEAVIALEKEQNDLLRQFLALDDPESAEWSATVENIYFKFVGNAQQIAAHYGYENYYDYAAKDIYMRDYTKAQRESFRENVKNSIIPYYLQIDAQYKAKRDQLSEEQKAQLSALRNEPCLQTNEYLSGYINSFPETMKTIMGYLFDRDAVWYSSSENAHQVAFTNYSSYCDQPYIFLGNGVQDLLTLVHELGHYAAFYHFVDASLPYDTAEVHSQGNEWLMLQYLNGKLDQEVYDTFLLWRLRYGLDTIILSTIVDEYEERVYTGNGISSPQDFRTIMNEVLDGYPGLAQIDTLESFYIYAQYVTIQSPVYYLSYATSELAAMSFYALADEKGYKEAQRTYIELCLETPTDKLFFETLQDVGLPDPFKANTVAKIIESFDSVLEADVVLPAA